MKLQATIAGHQAEIQIRTVGARVIAGIDGRGYELDLQESGANDYLLIHDGRVFECRAEGQPESGRTIEVVVGTSRFAITLTDLKRLRGAASLGAHGDGVARILAPMPGKIVRVLVAVGDHVEVGAGVAVVEAMKMQNEMKAPKAGTIITLNVAPGDTVNGGDVLAVIE